MQYVMFTDESYSTDSRYRSLAALSLHKSALEKAEKNMNNILSSSDVIEFKWKKLANRKYLQCADKIIDFILEGLDKNQIRMDILIWDTHDSRHEIFGRDDVANYERMVFHLFSNTMKKRPRNAEWDIIVDECNGIDWETAKDCLAAKGRQQQFFENTLFGSFYSDQYYSIKSFKDQCSHIEPLIQVADLFAGLAVFSKIAYDKFEEWKELNNSTDHQPTLFKELEEKPKENPKEPPSNREKFRFELLNKFNNKCKARKLGVSLESKRCLHTFDKRNPINFWHYEPQHENDKAPIRVGFEKGNSTNRAW